MGNVSALPALCEGSPPDTGGYPSQKTGNAGLDVSFDIYLNKRLNNRPVVSDLWRHETYCDVIVM